MYRWLCMGCLGLLALNVSAATSAPPGARVYFITPRDGSLVTSPLTVKFGLSGMGVAPAGVGTENTGHHHLLINVDAIDPTKPIIVDDQHRHFGGGQTEAVIELPRGLYSLQLLLGDQAHMPHQPPVVSKKITITVR